MVLGGCGGASGDGFNASAFEGSWFVAASEVEICTTGSHVTTLVGLLPIAADLSDSQVATEPANGCNLLWNVHGNVATLAGRQTCIVPGSVGGIWTATFTGGAMSLSGNVITLRDQGSAVLELGGPIPCTFTQSGEFTRN